jgi:hypothetical protein
MAVAATSKGLLIFHLNNTTRLPNAIKVVSQSPMAILPNSTEAPKIVPMAAAQAPLTNPCTIKLLRLRIKIGATKRMSRIEGRKIPTVAINDPQKPATKYPTECHGSAEAESTETEKIDNQIADSGHLLWRFSLRR